MGTNPLMVIGLAGKSGSGKNLLGQWLESLGFVHYDLDSWIHQGLEACKDSIMEKFGRDLLSSRGQINRTLLGQRVFSDPEKRQQLQNILYPWLEDIIEKELIDKTKAVLNGALLSESRLQHRCDCVLWIKTPWILRLKRIRKRDKRPLSGLLKRMSSQKFLKPQLFSPEVDIHIVKNFGKPDRMYHQVERVLTILEKKGQ